MKHADNNNNGSVYGRINTVNNTVHPCIKCAVLTHIQQASESILRVIRFAGATGGP